MTGREKCEMLRWLRAEVARDNKIPLKQEPCNHPGDDCSGTCALCERELQYLLEEIEKKERAAYSAGLKFREKEALKFQSDPVPILYNPLNLDDPTLPIPDEKFEECGYIKRVGPDEESI